VPFVSKATGMPVAKIAAKVMAGVSLAEQGIDSEPVPTHVSVKESVFPFRKFLGVDIVLGPELRSTGEVMGISERFSIAFAKSQSAAGTLLPKEGTIFISVAQPAKEHMVGLARRLSALGYKLMATDGTAGRLKAAGIDVEQVNKLQEGHPNLLDHLIDGKIQLIMNTPSGKGARTDEGRIRAAAVAHGVPCITTIQAADAAVRAMEALRNDEMTVQALQDRFNSLVSGK
jgi:carbamoyl-phosphate synthase large subunit